MKANLIFSLLAALFLILPGHPARGEDMREANSAFAEKKAAVLKQMEAEKNKAREEAKATRQRIISDKAALSKAIQDLESETLALEKENQGLEKLLMDLGTRENELKEKLFESDRVLGELMGVVRAGARDLKALLDQNFQTALNKQDLKKLKTLADQTAFPSMANIQDMVEIHFSEIKRSGEVRVEKAPFISASGEEVTGDVLVLGNFTAAYRFKGETGFLDYSPGDQKLSALARLPARSLQHKIQAYMDGKSADVPVDISRGGALRQLIHKTSFLEKIPQGGPIVWPIMAIAVLALIIIAERIYFLNCHKTHAAEFMDQIHAMANSGQWDPCREFCRQQKQNPLARVLLSGMAFLHMQREDMENAIQETILREIPPFEKYLSTLGMLAVIEPLLGLLGTVTGMINTFHVITFYGTGDPRMMSSGISEALVTTMLGLMAAIPILFAHTLLSGRVEHIIGEMEEKAISFINLVFKTRGELDPNLPG
jgi:biopolymer transport protein ExbB